MANIVDLSVEHVLMFVIVSFLLYHLIGGRGCSGNGFQVGADKYNAENIVKCPTKSGTQSPQCPLQDKECPSENYSAWVSDTCNCSCPSGQKMVSIKNSNNEMVKRCDHNAAVVPYCKDRVDCPDRNRMKMGMAYDCAQIKRNDSFGICSTWVDYNGFQCKDNLNTDYCTIDVNKPLCK